APAGSSSVEEILRERGAERREDGLRVELEPVHRQLAVAHGHHLALVTRRRDLESIGDAGRGERVVAAGVEGGRETGEEPAAVVVHRARLAVDEAPREADLAAEGLDDRLVAEADAEGRDAAA